MKKKIECLTNSNRISILVNFDTRPSDIELEQTQKMINTTKADLAQKLKSITMIDFEISYQDLPTIQVSYKP